MTLRQIVAIGGGGFSVEPDNPLLDAYVMALPGKPHQQVRVCFLPTASGDAAPYIAAFHRAMRRHSRKTSVVTLTPPKPANVAAMTAHLLAQDVIYVGGGDPVAMLDAWRGAGIDRTLRVAYDQGIILAGLSAGAMCWFELGLDDRDPGRFEAVPGLGFLAGSCSPYYDAHPAQRSAFHTAIAAGRLPPGFGLDDGAALHFVDGRLHRLVASRPDARVWRVAAASGRALPEALGPEYLGGRDLLIRRAAIRDAEGILAAHHRSVREISARDYTPEQVAAWTLRQPQGDSLQLLESQIRSDLLWVIEMAGVIEGYVHLRTPMEVVPAAYLHALYVTPSVAGRGLAKRLMALAEAEAVRRGLTGMELHASLTALGFYESLGYVEAGPPVVHVVQGVGLDCVPMRKDLGT